MTGTFTTAGRFFYFFIFNYRVPISIVFFKLTSCNIDNYSKFAVKINLTTTTYAK